MSNNTNFKNNKIIRYPLLRHPLSCNNAIIFDAGLFMKKSCVGEGSAINYRGIFQAWILMCLTVLIDWIKIEVHYESEV
jgi:hypothetical protein